MFNELIAPAGTVTIDTAEYRNLVEKSAYLNVIIACTEELGYTLQEVTRAVKGICTPSQNGDERVPDGASERTDPHS